MAAHRQAGELGVAAADPAGPTGAGSDAEQVLVVPEPEVGLEQGDEAGDGLGLGLTGRPAPEYSSSPGAPSDAHRWGKLRLRST